MATGRGARAVLTAGILALMFAVSLPAPAFASAPEAPILVSDPGSGATVVIFSRDEGGTTKLAWARREGSAWGAAHDLTFGPGLDFSPAVGIARTGTWLFWRGEKGRIFSAPVDLSRGHLLAVPRTLSGLADGLGGGTIRPEGGQDVPIIVQACDPTNPVLPCVSTGNSGPGTRNIPPQISPEGGQDVPIIGVIGTSATGSTTTTESGSLSVVSDANCDSQFVTLTEGRSILVFEFRGSGEVASQARVRVGPGIDPAEAAAAAADYFLRATCH
jgi:hypothetical protein